MSPSDTIAAIATPPGAGALAIVRVCGPGASRSAQLLLRRADGLPGRQAVLGTAWDRDRVIDRVVAVFFPARQSPLGEDLVEFTCHGSPYIQKLLLAALLDVGARLARPGEFTQRSYLNGRLDLAQAEAVCDLIRAGTGLAHRNALTQLEGGLSRAVAELRRPILDLLVDIEARLDHPDEDLAPIPPAEAAARFASLGEPVARLAGTFPTGRILRDGMRVGIVGRPNAGKSSLLNALLDCERAIVCAEPGTTRDTIEEPCDLLGLPTVLVDTAGLGHPSPGAADAESLRRTERVLASCDLALLVIDASRPPDPEDDREHRRVRESSAAQGRPLINVFNKCDIAAAAPTEPGTCAISALRKTGLGELKRLVLRRMAQDQARPVEGHGVSVTSQRHERALRSCVEELREAAESVARHPGTWEDLAARHLREALHALDEVTGPAAPDEVMGEIFSRFCVGK